MNLIIAVLIFVFSLSASFYAAANIGERHYSVGDKLYRATHIALPGYETVYYPADEVDLSKWAGSKFSELTAVNQDGTENPEATAAFALKAAGLYADYELKKKDNGHYVLYRPERTEKYFTMYAWYRIGPGHKAD